MYLYESSGNIRSQIGASLNAIRIKADEGDVLGVAHHMALLVAICAPKLSLDQMRDLAIPPMPGGRDRGGAKQVELYYILMDKLGKLLCILSDSGLYAYKDVPIGDAGDLALKEEDEEMVNLLPSE